MITIVDYGVGNIRSFLNVYRRLNIDAQTATTPRELGAATKIILPGVGSFDRAMEQLQGSGMRDTLDEMALRRRVPILGVCVGMQMLAASSDEGVLPGLGWIAGKVRGLGALMAERPLPLPHMGWNDVRVVSSGGLFDQLDAGARFYFLHSFYFDCERADDAAAVASYGREFACAVHAGNIYGVQFHPEKSHRWGTRLLQNFASL